MATELADETTFSSVDKAFMHLQVPAERVMSSGDDIRSTDDDTLEAQVTPIRTLGRDHRTRIALDCVARVKAGKNAKELAAGKLLKSTEKLPTSKFIITVNNMTDHDLVRLASSGGDSWPFSLIKKNECVAALYDHSYFDNLNAVFTADDNKPGIRTVMLSAHWPLIGNRQIGIYAGKTACALSWYKVNWQKVHDHDLDGNQAAINNPYNHYRFEYDINQLQYAQFGVAAGNEAVTEAIDKFTKFCIGSMPGFTFVVNNLTECDLTLAEVQGSWPLGNIKKGECAVAGFDQLNMSLAARYTGCVGDQQQNSISLAGSWPVLGNRKIYVGVGMKAKDAWHRLSEVRQNWPVKEDADDRLNSAYIEVKRGYSGKSCVFICATKNLVIQVILKLSALSCVNQSCFCVSVTCTV